MHNSQCIRIYYNYSVYYYCVLYVTIYNNKRQITSKYVIKIDKKKNIIIAHFIFNKIMRLQCIASQLKCIWIG